MYTIKKQDDLWYVINPEGEACDSFTIKTQAQAQADKLNQWIDMEGAGVIEPPMQQKPMPSVDQVMNDLFARLMKKEI